MKKIIPYSPKTLLIALILCTVAGAMISWDPGNPFKNHLQALGLKGNVKSVRVVFGEEKKDDPMQMYTEQYYNKKGNITLDMSPTDSSVYVYDDKDRVTEEKQYERYEGEPGELVKSVTYSYDSQNRVTAIKSYYEDTKLTEHTTYRYSADGKKIDFVTKSGGNEYKASKTVNDAGYDLEYINFGPDGNTVYIYDGKGKCIEIKDAPRNERITYAYTAPHGERTEQTIYDMKTGKKISGGTFKYDFDKKGNWTRSTGPNQSGNFDETITRTIKYY